MRLRPPAMWLASLVLSGAFGFLTGCAGPGSPRPPSLQLPQLVRDLTATRTGDEVQIRFSVSPRTTDGQRLRDNVLNGTLCRIAAKGGSCVPVGLPQSATLLRVPSAGSAETAVLWSDPLPSDMAAGPVRTLAYRVELRNEQGRSAGYSDPVYVAAGAAPPRVEDFRAQGTRLGVLFQWVPAGGPGEFFLQRERIDPAPPARRVSKVRESSPTGAKLPVSSGPSRQAPTDPGTVLLQPEPGHSATSELLDGSVQENVSYRYVAERRVTVQVGGRKLELRSAPSVPIVITWRDVYPPPVPQQLTALGYSSPQAAGASTANGNAVYGVDLIWQPVSDARVTGYVVTRQAISSSGDLLGAAERLTPVPVTVPAYHDATAEPSHAYRYGVSAVDAKGNTSAPATATVQASVR